MKPHSIGQLDQRVTFQAVAQASDGAGGQTETWSDIAASPTVWAKVVFRSGSEVMTGDKMAAEARVMFTIRNRRDLTNKMRILWNDRQHIIRAIHDFGAREMYLKIECDVGIPT